VMNYSETELESPSMASLQGRSLSSVGHWATGSASARDGATSRFKCGSIVESLFKCGLKF
jgi:hypothetical protein